MSSYLCLILSSLATFSYCINRPVYKIVLTQKGFAQFLQYDLETPTIREFTLCTWVRVLDLSKDQSVFTYVANGNNRLMRLWLDSGGKHMKISINGRASSSTLVDITKNTWRHVCISYQSDFGAWALYLDGRLASCEAAQSLYGFVLPSGGSVIVGYGTDGSGIPSGLEGEIFGANMILVSTIERNYTIKRHPQYQQKLFNKNKLLGNNNIKYIVLNDMSFKTIDNYETTKLSISNGTRNSINLKSSKDMIEHDVGLDITHKNINPIDASTEKEILDLSALDKSYSNVQNNDKINFWHLVNEAGKVGRFKDQSSKIKEQAGSGTQELPTISEYETPPPPVSFKDYTHTSLKINKPILKTFFEIKENDVSNIMKSGNEYKYELSDLVKPPPLEKNTKVYGQWTSSQFANSVLNYLKNINNENRKHKKIPSTIPLLKLSDAFPYASDYKITKVHPPLKLQQRSYMNNFKVIHKRDIQYPQINVKIFKDDLRKEILESHAKTEPKNVEITNRGQNTHSKKDHRFYRNANNQISNEHIFTSEEIKPRPFVATFKNNPSTNDIYKTSNLMTILPFIKSEEYFTDQYVDKKSVSNNDMYIKSLSNANKWHNVKSFNNDYTPRRINMDSDEFNTKIDNNIAAANKKYPAVRLKYKPDNHKVLKNVDDAEILNARTLAKEISTLSNTNSNSVSILKYNHGFLPNHKNITNKNNFNQNIKIGNALNERYSIGYNEEENKNSFIGGLEKIPDINRYRSDIDRESEIVPPSLGPKVCKNIEMYDRLFYVQPDGSVDITHILSPVKEKNIGIEFIAQNYKKCSLEESLFETSPLLFIDWTKTPVRLFGGSYPKKTTDLCGFF